MQRKVLNRVFNETVCVKCLKEDTTSFLVRMDYRTKTIHEKDQGETREEGLSVQFLNFPVGQMLRYESIKLSYEMKCSKGQCLKASDS